MQSADETESASIEALGALYEAGYHRFLRVAEAITGELQLAQDAVQDAFALAIRRRSQFRADGPLEGWVWRVVVNAACAVRRRRLDVSHAVPELAIDHLRESAADSLGPFIAGLPERQRLVLFLRYYADLDYEAIASALDIRPGTVGATLSHVHAAIRRHLEEVPS